MAGPIKLVMLDRDGVINTDISPHGTLHWQDFQFIEGSLQAIALLTQAQFQLVIITNQSAIGKGLMSLSALNEIHSHMLSTIQSHGGNIQKIYYCPDHPDHPSMRRKPNAGMLLEALHDFKCPAHSSIVIGDALRDMQAAHSAGCPRILVQTGKGKETLHKGLPDTLQPVTICDNLLAATNYIIHSIPKPNILN